MKLKKRLQAVLLAGMMALTATTAAIPSFTTISAQAEDTNNDDLAARRSAAGSMTRMAMKSG